MVAPKKIVASTPDEQEELDRQSEVGRQLAVYDNVRPFRPRESGFTKLGNTARQITRSPEAFRSAPVRQVHDPEKVDYVVPPQPARGAQTWMCDLCKFDTDGEYNHGWFRGQDGKPEACPKCGPAVIRARTRRKADASIRELMNTGRIFGRHNLPVDAHEYSLAAYPGKQIYVATIGQFVDGTIKEMLLTGEPGVGKSGLAISAVHELWKEGQQVLFMPMERYLDLLKENFGHDVQNNNIKAVMCSVDVLVIDDLGAGSLSESGFVVKETQDLIEMRHAAGLKTLITSNMSVDGLAGFWFMKNYERTGFQPGARIVSRLKGWYKVVEIKGKDLRMEE